MTDYEDQIFLGDSLEVLKGLPDEVFHAVVTDVPYGLGPHEPTLEEILKYLKGGSLNTGGDFMGRDWKVPSVRLWKEVFRVLKPGGHVLVFGGTRTFDLISMGLRVAGFENRDTIADEHPALQWIHGQGFPKNLNVAVALDAHLRTGRSDSKVTSDGKARDRKGLHWSSFPRSHQKTAEDTPTLLTPQAREWEGWGTALKPSWEPVLVFRKPLDGTVAENTLKHGTGAINTAACRVGSDVRTNTLKVPAENVNKLSRPGKGDSPLARGLGAYGVGAKQATGSSVKVSGRWPPNVVMTHAEGCKRIGTKEDGTETVEAWGCVEGCPVKALDEQSGDRPSTLTGRADPSTQHANPGNNHGASWFGGGNSQVYADQGGASRFFPQFDGPPSFYSAKVSKKEATLDGQIENRHPTKKPVKLMRWLVRLVTPKGGRVLDPYCGSGSTLQAACEEGVRYTGIDNDPESHATATARMDIVTGRERARQAQIEGFNLAMELADED